jgi:hypothetical protein
VFQVGAALGEIRERSPRPGMPSSRLLEQVPKIGPDHATEQMRVTSHPRVGVPRRSALAATATRRHEVVANGNCGAGINAGGAES